MKVPAAHFTTRCLTEHREELNGSSLHGFWDSSVFSPGIWEKQEDLEILCEISMIEYMCLAHR